MILLIIVPLLFCDDFSNIRNEIFVGVTSCFMEVIFAGIVFKKVADVLIKFNSFCCEKRCICGTLGSMCVDWDKCWIYSVSLSFYIVIIISSFMFLAGPEFLFV